MKICWDNLEKLIYRPDRGEWQNKEWKNMFYSYNNSCKKCHEPFLYITRSHTKFCSRSCAKSGQNHPGYGKRMSMSTRKKIQLSNSGEKHYLYGKHPSKETVTKMNKSHKGLAVGENNPNWQGGYYKKGLAVYNTYAPQISYVEAVRRNKQDLNILEVKCAYCGKWYLPSNTQINARINALEGRYTEGSEYRLYCSDNCKQECPVYKRVLWPKGFKPATSREIQPQLRQLVFERDDYTCQKCGKIQDELKTGLHCHHITGVKQNPIESADIDNCITLCKDCHKWVHQQDGCKYHELRCKGE